jgi:hypothetical protein
MRTAKTVARRIIVTYQISRRGILTAGAAVTDAANTDFSGTPVSPGTSAPGIQIGQ